MKTRLEPLGRNQAIFECRQEKKELVGSSVMRVGSDTFVDPIFQKGSQN